MNRPAQRRPTVHLQILENRVRQPARGIGTAATVAAGADPEQTPEGGHDRETTARLGDLYQALHSTMPAAPPRVAGLPNWQAYEADGAEKSVVEWSDSLCTYLDLEEQRSWARDVDRMAQALAQGRQAMTQAMSQGASGRPHALHAGLKAALTACRHLEGREPAHSRAQGIYRRLNDHLKGVGVE